MASKKSPRRRARAALKARAKEGQRVWFVEAFQAREYVVTDDGPYRRWISVWIDVRNEVVIRVLDGKSLADVVSAEAFEMAAEDGMPTGLHVCGTKVAKALIPNLPEGVVAGVDISDEQHAMATALVDEVIAELEEDAPEGCPVALATLASAESRAALIEAANRFAAVSLGLEPEWLRIEVGGESRVVLVVESSVLVLRTLEQIQDVADQDERVADALSLVLVPRRSLDLDIRAEIEAAEPAGSLSECVAMTLCTDSDRIARPATYEDLVELLRYVPAATAWVEDPEAGEFAGATIERIDLEAPALGLEGGDQAFQMKVVLDGTEPPVWRRIVVPASATLEGLHHVIQRAMGWEDEHLHEFKIGKQTYCPDPNPYVDNGIEEYDVRLGDVLRPRQKLTYLYDFGDSWEHTITVEKVLADHDGPECTGGEGACPPEDCGGVWGYADMLETLANPRAADREELLKRLGSDFDPAALDLAAASRAVRSLAGI